MFYRFHSQSRKLYSCSVVLTFESLQEILHTSTWSVAIKWKILSSFLLVRWKIKQLWLNFDFELWVPLGCHRATSNSLIVSVCFQCLQWLFELMLVARQAGNTRPFIVLSACFVRWHQGPALAPGLQTSPGCCLSCNAWLRARMSAFMVTLEHYAFVSPLKCSTLMLYFNHSKFSVSPKKSLKCSGNAHYTEEFISNFNPLTIKRRQEHRWTKTNMAAFDSLKPKRVAFEQFFFFFLILSLSPHFLLKNIFIFPYFPGKCH